MPRKLILATAALATLAGCAPYDAVVSAANTYTKTEIDAQQSNIQGMNDNAILVWTKTGCSIPYGAVIRNASTIPGLPVAMESLCGTLPLPRTPTALGGSVPTSAK